MSRYLELTRTRAEGLFAEYRTAELARRGHDTLDRRAGRAVAPAITTALTPTVFDGGLALVLVATELEGLVDTSGARERAQLTQRWRDRLPAEGSAEVRRA